jgi:amino acid transporter
MPAIFGRTHPTHETPVAALAAVAGIVTVLAAGAIALGRAPIDAFSDTATLCSYAFVVVYGAVALGASVYLRQLGELRRRNIVVSAVAVAFLLVPAIGSVYPVPPWPANCYPLGFALYAALGIGLLWRRPQIAPATSPANP